MAERETSLEERQRHDQEKADANNARRVRQGGIEILAEEASPPPAKKRASRAKAPAKKRASRAKASASKKK